MMKGGEDEDEVTEEEVEEAERQKILKKYYQV